MIQIGLEYNLGFYWTTGQNQHLILLLLLLKYNMPHQETLLRLLQVIESILWELYIYIKAVESYVPYNLCLWWYQLPPSYLNVVFIFIKPKKVYHKVTTKSLEWLDWGTSHEVWLSEHFENSICAFWSWPLRRTIR